MAISRYEGSCCECISPRLTTNPKQSGQQSIRVDWLGLGEGFSAVHQVSGNLDGTHDQYSLTVCSVRQSVERECIACCEYVGGAFQRC